MNDHRVAAANRIHVIVVVIISTTINLAACKASGPIGRPSRGANDAVPDSKSDASAVADHASHRSNKRWHMDLAIRNSYPKLDSTQQQLDRRMDLPLKIDVFGVFDRPYTPIDRRSDQGFTTLYGGVGRQENSRFLWTYYFGGGSGNDINHGRFLFQTLEVDFKYNLYYTGILAEYYPWEIPSIHATPSWEERLLASRPFLLAGLESGYASSEGEGDYKITGWTVYHDEAKVRDWLFSCNIGLGWALPLNDRWSINVYGDYRFHFYRPEEYNAWNITTGIRYRF